MILQLMMAFQRMCSMVVEQFLRIGVPMLLNSVIGWEEDCPIS